MTTVTQMKCACEPCLCIVDTNQAIQKNGQYYCSEGCANGHSDNSTGCGHTGCSCHK